MPKFMIREAITRDITVEAENLDAARILIEQWQDQGEPETLWVYNEGDEHGRHVEVDEVVVDSDYTDTWLVDDTGAILETLTYDGEVS